MLAAKPNLRLLLTGGLLGGRPGELRVRSVAGGLLVQERDLGVLDEDQLRVVTARAPTAAEIADLRFAFAVCKHVKSNAIVFAKEGATVGIGAGQMSRLDPVRIAVAKASEAASSRRGRRQPEGQRARLRMHSSLRRRSGGGAERAPRRRSSRAAACATTR